MSSTFGDLEPKDRLGVSAGELTGSAPNPWDAPKAMRIIVAICKQHRGVGIGVVGMGGFGGVRTLRGVCFENDADISLAVFTGRYPASRYFTGPYLIGPYFYRASFYRALASVGGAWGPGGLRSACPFA